MVPKGQIPGRVPRAGFPLHRENRENGIKQSLSGKTQPQGNWKFCQNTGNLFAEVVNTLILKVP